MPRVSLSLGQLYRLRTPFSTQCFVLYIDLFCALFVLLLVYICEVFRHKAAKMSINISICTYK